MALIWLASTSTLVAAPLLPPTASQLAYQEALYQYYLGDYGAALGTLLVAESRLESGAAQPGAAPAATAVARPLLKAGLSLAYGMPRTAQPLLTSLLKVPAQKDMASYFLALLAYQQADYGLASEYLQQLSEQAHLPLEDTPPALLRADIALREANPGQASQMLEQLHARSNGYLLTALNIANHFSRQGDYASASDYYQQVSLAGTEVSPWFGMSWQRAAGQQASPEPTQLRHKGLLAAGYSALEAGEPLAAQRWLQQLPNTSPLALQGLLGQGWSYYQQGHYSAALAAWQDVERLSADAAQTRQQSQIVEASLGVAVALEQLHQQQAALDQYQALAIRLEVRLAEIEQLLQTPVLLPARADFSWQTSQAFQADTARRLALQQLASQSRSWLAKLDVYAAALAAKAARRRLQPAAVFETNSGAALRALQTQQHQAHAWLADVEQRRDYVALLSAAEQKISKRIERARNNLALLQDCAAHTAAVPACAAPALAAAADRLQRYTGIQLWQASQSWHESLWQRQKQQAEIDQALASATAARLRVTSLLRDDHDINPLEARIVALQDQLQQQLQRLNGAMLELDRRLLASQRLALGEQQRLAKSQIAQVQLAIARLYDPSNAQAASTTDWRVAEQGYLRALAVVDNAADQQQIRLRLANLQRDQAEQQVWQGAQDDRSQASLQQAIGHYEDLLAAAGQAGATVNGAEILYQLARSYDLAGDSDKAAARLAQLLADYPDAPLVIEAHFRLAEFDYISGDYSSAAAHYAQVVSAAVVPVFATNARYMYGWSLFKLNDYPGALTAFMAVLDSLPGFAQLADLPPTSRRLGEDTLRVMSIAFSYLDGGSSISNVLAIAGVRPYAALLYQQLADFYQEKARFDDSVASLRAFLTAYPDDVRGPGLQASIIALYTKAGFSDLLAAEQSRYVAAYGRQSDFWAQHRHDNQVYSAEMLLTLQSSLTALADAAHARTQAQPKDAVLQQLAAQRYTDYVQTFSDAPAAGRYWFLLAEVRLASGDRLAAEQAYATVAYDRHDPQFGADAGYNHWLLATTADAAEQGARATRFNASYANDERLLPMLAESARALLAAADMLPAAALAQQLLASPQVLPPALAAVAHQVLARSYFAQQQFAFAEAEFRQLLAIAPGDRDTAEADVRQWLATSIYQQGLQARDNQQIDEAIDHLLRVAQVAPQTKIHRTADYEAALLAVDAKRWQQAESLLLAYQQGWPADDLLTDVDVMLVSAYEGQQRWSDAVTVLVRMAGAETNQQVQASHWWLAAEYAVRAGDLAAAVNSYRYYANHFAEPAARQLEAQYQLTRLYTELEIPSKADYWRRSIIQANAAAGAQASVRSRYLAAEAAMVFAESEFTAFAKLPLTLPLARSLPRKQAALSRALAAYQGVQGLGVAEFQSQANFRIGAIYQQLARDLLASTRPPDLDADALMAYDLLLEEQAYPFEELAIELHAANAQQSWDAKYDRWIAQSYVALAQLLPARYNKTERVVESADDSADDSD
ncbi:MAG: hypothetical protein NWR26_05505 [Pseudomonadales bacterium]|nr:hypothetical protein [Pseudomonadales bacterium]